MQEDITERSSEDEPGCGSNDIPNIAANEEGDENQVRTQQEVVKCALCGEKGHKHYQCALWETLVEKLNAGQQQRQQQGCRNCGSCTHSTEDCPGSDNGEGSKTPTSPEDGNEDSDGSDSMS